MKVLNICLYIKLWTETIIVCSVHCSAYAAGREVLEHGYLGELWYVLSYLVLIFQGVHWDTTTSVTGERADNQHLSTLTQTHTDRPTHLKINTHTHTSICPDICSKPLLGPATKVLELLIGQRYFGSNDVSPLVRQVRKWNPHWPERARNRKYEQNVGGKEVHHHGENI